MTAEGNVYERMKLGRERKSEKRKRNMGKVNLMMMNILLQINNEKTRKGENNYQDRKFNTYFPPIQRKM